MTIRKILPVIVCCLTILQFTSCQKDYVATTETPTDSTSTIKNDSTLLKLFVVLDTLHPVSKDTLYKMEFEYDNLKRLASYVYSYYDTATGEFYDAYLYKIFYDGTNVLPFKVTSSELGSLQVDAEFATYYKNGNLSYLRRLYPISPSDSIISIYENKGDSDVIFNYPYPDTSIFENETVYHNAVLSDGNVLHDHWIYSYERHGYTMFLAGFGGVFTYDNLFDTHSNPFKKISFIFQLSDLFPTVPSEDGTYFYTMAKSNNNIIDSKFNRVYYSFTDNNYYTKDYIYNGNGLPLSASYTKILSQANQVYAGRELYFYTK